MKNLLIIRHAKSSWEDPYLDDHQRPLSPRGLKDIPTISRKLTTKGVHLEWIISSDADRAKSTALLLAQSLGPPAAELVFSRDLYHASAQRLLDQIRKAPDHYQNIGIVGHNPGMNELIWMFSGEIDNLPTAGIYGITFSAESWKEVSPGNSSFWFFDFPKK
jgi:phosphohistidine phosphatase